MRKALAFLLAIFMVISLAACVAEEDPVTSENAIDRLYSYSISTKESTLKEGVLPEASESEAGQHCEADTGSTAKRHCHWHGGSRCFHTGKCPGKGIPGCRLLHLRYRR